MYYHGVSINTKDYQWGYATPPTFSGGNERTGPRFPHDEGGESERGSALEGPDIGGRRGEWGEGDVDGKKILLFSGFVTV